MCFLLLLSSSLASGCSNASDGAVDVGATGGSSAGGVSAGGSSAGGSSAGGVSAGGSSAGGSSGAGGGGVPGTGAGESGSSSGAGGTEPVLGGDGFPATCDELSAADDSATARLSLELALEMNGVPLTLGEPNPLAAGGTILPTNLRFYLSQFALHHGDEVVPILPVDAAGTPIPYGIVFANAEDASTWLVELAFPPGAYDSLSFIWGLREGCNLALQAMNPPLDEASQLKWPHSLGFLFLRMEGTLDDSADPETPTMIHMGAAAGPDGYAPSVQLPLPLPATEAVTLHVAVDQALVGAASDVDLSDFELNGGVPATDPEIRAGERLRRTSGNLEIFSLSGR